MGFPPQGHSGQKILTVLRLQIIARKWFKICGNESVFSRMHVVFLNDFTLVVMRYLAREQKLDLIVSGFSIHFMDVTGRYVWGHIL